MCPISAQKITGIGTLILILEKNLKVEAVVRRYQI